MPFITLVLANNHTIALKLDQPSKIRIENISKRIADLIFLNIHSTTRCFDPSTKFDFKINGFNWKKPNLNAQKNHLGLTLPQFFFVFY